MVDGVWGPDLDQLEPLVSVNNATVAEDYYAYQEAVQAVQEVRGGLFPTIGLTGSATRSGAEQWFVRERFSGGSATTMTVSNGPGRLARLRGVWIGRRILGKGTARGGRGRWPRRR